MTPIFQVLSGGRAGAVFSPAGDDIVLGRHADAALQLDPDVDLAVSGRHARVQRRGDDWLLTDLASRNGTWLNGTRIESAVVLHAGDRILLGQGGPELRFELARPAAESATERIRAAVRRERRRFLVLSGVLLLLVLLLTALVARQLGRGARWEQERGRLQATIDSLIDASQASSASLANEVAGLGEVLAASERRLERLKTELAGPRGDEEGLRRDLLAARAALQLQQLAASLDYRSIERRARGAVAMLWVEYANGQRVTGTAFAVRADGLLLTAAHLLYGPAGELRPVRIAVRFSDSEQTFPARALAAGPDLDVAALRVENVLGEIPAVPGLNLRADTLAPGTPLAIIGFPLSGDGAGDPAAATRVARPLVSAGVLLAGADDSVLEVQGYGEAGASGSPILDASGQVVALLFGGRRSGAEQVLLGVPARAAAAFLATLRD